LTDNVASATNADTLDGYHYNQTSRGFINIDYNRNGPYWMLIASRDYSTDQWAWAKMVFTIASSAYAGRTVTYGIVEIAYNHQNTTAASAPKISAKWLLKSLSTQDDSVRVEINTSTKYINVYLQNNLWDSKIECNVIHADGFNYLGHGLTAGSWTTAPALSTNVINPSNATYYGNLIKDSSSDSYVLLGGGGHKTLNNLQVTGTASALNALDVTKTFIYATVSSNQTLGVSAAMTVGQVLTVLVYNSGSSSITVTVPTSDSWKSLDGLSLTIGA